MKTAAHLWAIGFDDMQRAAQVRDEIVSLGWVDNYLLLLDVAVVVRARDGSFALDREPFPAAANIAGCTTVGLLAGLLLGAPLAGMLVGGLVASAGAATAGATGIDADFVREVEALMRPGTSALFVLDDEGDMEVILHKIRGLGGKVLKSNVDVDRVRQIQSTLATESAPSV